MATFFKDASFCRRSFISATLLLLLCSCTIPTVPAQLTPSGYLNINCGANVPTVDAATGLRWVPDAPYITTGKTRSVVLPTTLESFTEMGTLRYFDDLRSKNCYALPVVPGGTYLLRATFYYGNYDNAYRLPTFQVTLDATLIDNMTNTSWAAFYSEFHYQAQGNVSYLCLIRISPTSGAPFISGISLKEASGLYSGYADEYARLLQEGNIMKTRSRVNYGGASYVLRAPEDYYDRFWIPEGPSTPVNYLRPATAAHEFVSTSVTFTDMVGSDSWPPSAVMQTAVTSAGTLATYLLPDTAIGDDMDVYFAIYFAELNSSSSPLGNRNFTTTIPEITTYSPTVDLKFWVFLSSGYLNMYLKGVQIRNTTTMFLNPLPSSTAGPILTAIEVFASQPRVSKTADRDALAIEDIKQSLNLTEWTGDPCQPSPHDWLTCAIANPSKPQPVITAVNLSGRHLKGSIPASFGNLLDLTSLDLSSNNLSGPVPDWLTTMTALRVLSVQNNNLSGILPAGLFSANSKIKFTYKPGNEYLVSTISPTPNRKTNIARIVGESVGAIVALLVVLALAICACRRYQRKHKPNLSNDQHQQGPTVKRTATTGGAKAYTLAQVTAATSNFKNELGKGGFGPVYYGKLPDGHEVAVKVAKGTSNHEERAFFNEVDVLSRVHHKNLVSLVGYCQEEKQILLYEYMYNGSLFDHLHGKSANSGVLDWQRRLHIALNAAQGLEYLHTGCSPSFIHRDVKSSNILLTPKYDAKVADFGLTRLLGESEGTRVLTDVMGTAGYLDPEYLISHYISPKSDVYSFGIVLLELITGSLPINKFASDARNPNIAQWVRESLVKNDINSILDPMIKDSHLNTEVVWKVADIAMRSVEPKSTHRPTMSEVVQELQGALAMNATSVPSNYSTQVSGPTSFPEPR